MDGAVAKRAARRVGTTLCRRYRVLRLIGLGGMAAVYAGVHRSGHVVAIKVLHERLSADPDVERLFRREALLANTIRHAGVVPILDDDVTEDGCVFLVMNLLEGETLYARSVRFGRELPIAEVARIAHALLDILQAAHAMKIVHRDIKPENVFITREGVVHILDFGIGRFFETSESTSAASVTRTGRTLGTPAFMAPEQALGRIREVDGRSDLWSVGATMFTLLSGRFVHEAETGSELLVMTATRPPRPLAEVAPEVPGPLRAVVDRALSFDKASRWPDAATMADALARACELAFGVPPSKLPPLDAPHSRAALLEAIHDATTLHTGPLVSRTTAAVESPFPKRIALVLALLAVVAVIALAGFVRRRYAAPHDASPLAVAESKLACPILEASGAAEPSGWLGAAAAATVCERARVILGGSASRTLVPAELLSLPARPADGALDDPYGVIGARERSIAAARRDAEAYIDGKVTKEASGFRIVLSLHRADGSEIVRAEGRGRALYEAVREAMIPLIAPERIPRARALEPVFEQWSRAKDVDSALALLDVTLAMSQNAGTVASECRKLAAQRTKIAEMGPLIDWLCAYTLGVTPPPITAAAIDPAPSPGALAVRARTQHMALRMDDPGAIARLQEAFEREQTLLGRSSLAATLSCMVQASDPKRAADLARLSVELDPKNPMGEFCTPWGQVMETTTDTSSMAHVISAMQAWVPWDDNAWMATALAKDDPKKAIAYARRAYALAPFDANAAGVLADNLLGQGAREEVRSMALGMGAAPYPVQKVESELLLVRASASEARFGEAFARALRALRIDAGDTGWVRAQRFEIAWYALEIGGILGRGAEAADLIAARFMDPEPPPLDGMHVMVPQRIPAICARASAPVSRRCFARFRDFRSHVSGGILPDTDAFTEGAERYANGDWRGAAKAWKPLLRAPGLFARVLPDAMEAVFERSGDDELVQRLEAMGSGASANEYNGALPADVRAAKRAAKRGDMVRARLLAQRIIEAWGVADETVPAVAEMRKLRFGIPGPL